LSVFEKAKAPKSVHQELGGGAPWKKTDIVKRRKNPRVCTGKTWGGSGGRIKEKKNKKNAPRSNQRGKKLAKGTQTRPAGDEGQYRGEKGRGSGMNLRRGEKVQITCEQEDKKVGERDNVWGEETPCDGRGVGRQEILCGTDDLGGVKKMGKQKKNLKRGKESWKAENITEKYGYEKNEAKIFLCVGFKKGKAVTGRAGPKHSEGWGRELMEILPGHCQDEGGSAGGG